MIEYVGPGACQVLKDQSYNLSPAFEIWKGFFLGWRGGGGAPGKAGFEL